MCMIIWSDDQLSLIIDMMIIWSDNHLDIDNLVGRVVLRKRHWGNPTWERHLVKTSSTVIIWWWHQHRHNHHGDHHIDHHDHHIFHTISIFPKTTRRSLPYNRHHWSDHHDNHHDYHDYDDHRSHPISSLSQATQGPLPHFAFAQLWEEPRVAVPLSRLIVKIIIKISSIAMMAIYI